MATEDLEKLNELLAAAEHWFGKADDEENLEPAAQYAVIASAGAQLVMAKLAAQLHGAALQTIEERPMAVPPLTWKTLALRCIEIAQEALGRIDDNGTASNPS